MSHTRPHVHWFSKLSSSADKQNSIRHSRTGEKRRLGNTPPHSGLFHRLEERICSQYPGTLIRFLRLISSHSPITIVVVVVPFASSLGDGLNLEIAGIVFVALSKQLSRTMAHRPCDLDAGLWLFIAGL